MPHLCTHIHTPRSCFPLFPSPICLTQQVPRSATAPVLAYIMHCLLLSWEWGGGISSQAGLRKKDDETLCFRLSSVPFPCVKHLLLFA
jgi:hypothetical protein